MCVPSTCEGDQNSQEENVKAGRIAYFSHGGAHGGRVPWAWAEDSDG